MNQISSRRLGLLDLGARSRLVQAGAVAAGILLLTVASWTEVPMLPVPMTMPTFAVLLVGALYGWRLGALTVAAWPACAAGIGRASGRERVCQYGYISVVAGSLNKKKTKTEQLQDHSNNKR